MSKIRRYKRLIGLLMSFVLLVPALAVPVRAAEAGDRLAYAKTDYSGLSGFSGFKPTSDGGFIGAGRGTVMKIGPDGAIEWSRETIGGDLPSLMSVGETPDGGYVYAGSADPDYKWVYGKLDGAGNVLWQRSEPLYGGVRGSFPFPAVTL
ncbi:hypothetical protein [Cohnella algarum]|uniref:hypothetical protein n=1 Tax=Cohnella algarum TaxID=2044859 RepID=UPI001967D111|nr:hypothetical protein [Cohnella algarum]MBN2980359.1 hypothetical protein [Cohnella algarum]